ncbi:TRAM domain-containing protein [Candidatus Woesearchaeota archaeon]|nr:TRAM domain-containing protein [Candidatus Woesearchaeota archaeon]
MYGDRGFRPRGGGGGFAPVKVGDEIDVKIEAVGEKGDGIAKKEGFVLFVPNTKEGDEVKIRITKVLRKVGFADVVGEGQAAPEGEEKPAEEEPAAEEKPAAEESAEEAPAAEEPAAEPSAEDTEDFGEEPEEKKEE